MGSDAIMFTARCWSSVRVIAGVRSGMEAEVSSVTLVSPLQYPLSEPCVEERLWPELPHRGENGDPTPPFQLEEHPSRKKGRAVVALSAGDEHSVPITDSGCEGLSAVDDAFTEEGLLREPGVVHSGVVQEIDAGTGNGAILVLVGVRGEHEDIVAKRLGLQVDVPIAPSELARTFMED